MKEKKLIKELAEELARERDKNEKLTYLCSAYVKGLEEALSFIKSSHLMYEEFCKYQMEEWEREHEVTA